ncbi:hypothetical protein [Mycolicibacterium peregrinum]|uniref:hypothetical protein n=1 Tax=Mycolicibacterium peregrinum TaxID=43304 RepID=UPI003AAF6F8B
MTIDGQNLKARQTAGSNRSYIEFPLGLFPKALLGSFGVCDSAGRALPLMGSEYDSTVAVGIMVHELVRQGVKTSSISPGVLDKLFRVASKQNGDEIEGDLLWMIQTSDSPDRKRLREIFGPELFEIITSIPDADEFCEILWAFGQQYVPVIRIDRRELAYAFVVKYSEITHSPEMGLWNRAYGTSYLWDPRGGLIDIEAVNLGRAGSQHFRVSAPEGTVLTAAVMIDPESNEESNHTHIVHVTPRWASLYTNFEEDQGKQNVRLTLIPDARAVMFPAILALMLTLLIIGMGLLLQISDTIDNGRIPPRLEEIAAHSSGAVVALFILLPSFYMLAVFRRGEHGIASNLLRQPRYAMLVASSIAIAACIPATFSVSSRFMLSIWGLTFVTTMTALVLIVRHWWRIECLERAARLSWNRDQMRGGPPSSAQ